MISTSRRFLPRIVWPGSSSLFACPDRGRAQKVGRRLTPAAYFLFPLSHLDSVAQRNRRIPYPGGSDGHTCEAGGMTPFIFCYLRFPPCPRINYWDVSGKRFDVRSRPAEPGWRVARGLGRWVDRWDLQRFTVVHSGSQWFLSPRGILQWFVTAVPVIRGIYSGSSPGDASLDGRTGPSVRHTV